MGTYPNRLSEPLLITHERGHYLLNGRVYELNPGRALKQVVEEIKDCFAYKEACTQIADHGHDGDHDYEPDPMRHSWNNGIYLIEDPDNNIDGNGNRGENDQPLQE